MVSWGIASLRQTTVDFYFYGMDLVDGRDTDGILYSLSNNIIADLNKTA
jgi:hypothetical protein